MVYRINPAKFYSIQDRRKPLNTYKNDIRDLKNLSDRRYQRRHKAKAESFPISTCSKSADKYSAHEWNNVNKKEKRSEIYVPDYLTEKYNLPEEAEKKIKEIYSFNSSRKRKAELKKEIRPYFEDKKNVSHFLSPKKLQGNFQGIENSKEFSMCKGENVYEFPYKSKELRKDFGLVKNEVLKYNDKGGLGISTAIKVIAAAGTVVLASVIATLNSNKDTNISDSNPEKQIEKQNHSPELNISKTAELKLEDAREHGWSHKLDVKDADNDTLDYSLDNESGKYFKVDNGTLSIEKDKIYDKMNGTWILDPGTKDVKINVSDKKGGYAEGILKLNIDHKQTPAEIKAFSAKGYENEKNEKGIEIKFEGNDTNEINGILIDVHKDSPDGLIIKTFDIKNTANDKKEMSVNEKIQIRNSLPGGIYYIKGKIYDNGTFFNATSDSTETEAVPFDLPDLETFIEGRMELSQQPDKLLLKFKLADYDSFKPDGQYLVRICKDSIIIDSKNIDYPRLNDPNEIEFATNNPKYRPDDQILIELVKLNKEKEERLDILNTTIGNSAPMIHSPAVSFLLNETGEGKLMKYNILDPILAEDDRGIEKIEISLKLSNGEEQKLQEIEAKGAKSVGSDQLEEKELSAYYVPGVSELIIRAIDIDSAVSTNKSFSDMPDIQEKFSEGSFKVELNTTGGEWFEIFGEINNPDGFAGSPEFRENISYNGTVWLDKEIKLNEKGDGIYCFYDKVDVSKKPAGKHLIKVENKIISAEAEKPPRDDPSNITIINEWFNPIVKEYHRIISINDTDSEVKEASGMLKIGSSYQKEFRYNIINSGVRGNKTNDTVAEAVVDLSDAPQGDINVTDEILNEFGSKQSAEEKAPSEGNNTPVEANVNYKIKDIEPLTPDDGPSVEYDNIKNEVNVKKMGKNLFDNERLDDSEKIIPKKERDYLKDSNLIIIEQPLETTDNLYAFFNCSPDAEKSIYECMKFIAYFEKLKHDVLNSASVPNADKNRWTNMSFNLIVDNETFAVVGSYDFDENGAISEDWEEHFIYTRGDRYRYLDVVDNIVSNDVVYKTTLITEFDKYLSAKGFDFTKNRMKDILIGLMDSQYLANSSSKWSSLPDTFDFENDQKGVSAMRKISELLKLPGSYDPDASGKKNSDFLKDKITNTIASRFKANPADLNSAKIILKYDNNDIFKFSMDGVQKSNSSSRNAEPEAASENTAEPNGHAEKTLILPKNEGLYVFRNEIVVPKVEILRKKR